MSRQTFRLQRYPSGQRQLIVDPRRVRWPDRSPKKCWAHWHHRASGAAPEADDLLCHAGHPGRERGLPGATGDRDALQLVSDDAGALQQVGVSELTRFTPEVVVEKYGSPLQYSDFFAMLAITCPAYLWRMSPNGSPSRLAAVVTGDNADAVRQVGRCCGEPGRGATEPTDLVRDVLPGSRPWTRWWLCAPWIATTFTGSDDPESLGVSTGCSTRWPRPGTRGRGVRRARLAPGTAMVGRLTATGAERA